jgi:protein-tyrosine phosphatase
MLDLHCHILPAVDDGPPTLDEALALARFCVRDGITHVVATPHCHRHTRLLRADVLPHVARFNAELAAAWLPLTVLPGSEVQVTDVDEYRREYDAGLYCHLNDNPAFTLLEFSWHARLYPPGAAGLVAWLVGRGTRPVIAHPERHDFFRADPARLRALAEAGAWLQVTVDSLLGNHGPAPRASADELLRLYPDVVLATDAHNTRRCSGLSAGYRLVGEHCGPDRAEDLRARADHVLRHILGPSPGGAAANSPG